MDLWTVLIPILITDVVNPVLLGATVYALGAANPIRNTSLLLLGHTLAYFVAGLLLALGFEYLMNLLQNPRPIDFAIQLLIGALLLSFGVASARSGAKPSDREFETGKAFGPWAALLLGMTVNVIGLPFAIPYFAALDQILKADLNWTGALGALVAYNLIYALPFAALVGLRWAAGNESDRFLAKLTQWVDKIGGFLMPILLLMLGAALVADAVWFFWRGTPLFDV